VPWAKKSATSIVAARLRVRDVELPKIRRPTARAPQSGYNLRVPDSAETDPPVLTYQSGFARASQPGWHHLRPRYVVLGLAIVAASAAVVGLISFLSWYLPFSARMARAEARAGELTAAVSRDPRFADVTFSSFTGGGGVLMIDGWVATAADLAALQGTVGNPGPKIPVFWHVVVSPPKPAATTPATRPVRSDSNAPCDSRP
jgi:hypothetical protein